MPIKCDHCGKPATPQNVTTRNMRAYYRDRTRTYDLCKDCLKQLHNLLTP